MKDEKFPTHLELMRPTLEAVKQLGGSGNNEEILDKVVVIAKIPEEMQEATIPNGSMSKFEYNAGWARSYLKMAGAINNSSVGVWSITKEGQTLTDEEILKRIRAKQKENRQRSKEKKQKDSPESLAEDQKELNETSFNEQGDNLNFNVDWKEKLLNVIKNIKPDAFERLCQRILREAGFINVVVTGKIGDGGIDGLGRYRVNLITFYIAFQCKRYKDTVGSDVVRNFRGSMQGNCEKGLIITTGSFTKQAREEAVRSGALAIDLIDGDELCQQLKKLKLGVETEIVENYKIDAEWFNNI